jgi:hypothetical protein
MHESTMQLAGLEYKLVSNFKAQSIILSLYPFFLLLTKKNRDMSTANLILEEDITTKETASMDANSGRVHMTTKEIAWPRRVSSPRPPAQLSRISKWT